MFQNATVKMLKPSLHHQGTLQDQLNVCEHTETTGKAFLTEPSRRPPRDQLTFPKHRRNEHGTSFFLNYYYKLPFLKSPEVICR